MKKLAALFILSFTLFTCENDDTPIQVDPLEEFLIEGKTYELTNYSIENSVDLNGDNLFSTDLLEEGADCFVNELFFDNDNVFWSPTRRTIAFTVSNGTQNNYCVEPDVAMLTYQKEENIINISFNNQFYYSAQLTEDSSVLTFIIPFEYLLGFGFFGDNDFLNQGGVVEEYTGSATLVYNLIE